MSKKRLFLAADIGATKVDAQLLTVEEGRVSTLALGLTMLADLCTANCTFGDYLEQNVRPPLREAGYEFEQLDGGLFCAAGLVKDGVVEHEPYPRGRFDVAAACVQLGIPRYDLLNDGAAQAMALYRGEVWKAATVLHAGKEADREKQDPGSIGFMGLGTGLAFTHNHKGEVIGSEGGNTRIGWIPNLSQWCPASAGLYQWLERNKTDDDCRWETIVSINGLKVLAEFFTGRTIDKDDVDTAVAQTPAIGDAFVFWAGVRAGSMVVDGPGLTGVALRGAHNMEVFRGRGEWFLKGLRAVGVRGRTMAEHKLYVWYQVPKDTWFGLVAWAERRWPELFA